MSYHFKVEVEIPDWADWVAQDKCGAWWVYENKPRPGADNTYWEKNGGQWIALYKGKPPKDWTQEIYEIWR